MKLEVVALPVSDVDRAKDFYQKLGFRLDADRVVSEDYRIVQFTPPESGASIVFGTGITNAPPGSVGELQLVVYDLDEARRSLLERGVEVSEIFHDATGVFHHAGTAQRVPGPHPERSEYGGSFASFADPDGNGWLLQQIRTRLPGR